MICVRIFYDFKSGLTVKEIPSIYAVYAAAVQIYYFAVSALETLGSVYAEIYI
jgi:hypothetical protein